MAEVSPYIEDIRRGLQQYDLTSLTGSRILITGATGLIGGCLVDILIKDAIKHGAHLRASLLCIDINGYLSLCSGSHSSPAGHKERFFTVHNSSKIVTF